MFDASIAKIDRMRQSQVNQRRDTWTQIQTQAPDVARFLTQISATFGKPAAVRVEIVGRVVLEQGVLIAPKHDKYRKLA